MNDRQLARFTKKVSVTDTCWNWTASLKPNGYGQFGLDGVKRSAYAHRVAYEHYVGPIPPGLEIDHLCFNRACVNPDHLTIVTHAENCLRGQGLAAVNSRKTHCPQGHAYTQHGMTQADGSRKCRVCHNARQFIRNRRIRSSG